MIGFELLSIEPENVPDAIGQLIKNGGRMQMVYGWQPDDGHLELRYLASRAVKQDFLYLRPRNMKNDWSPSEAKRRRISRCHPVASTTAISN
ncbi:MAG TPA: hypothetical protein DCL72_15700 [Rhizobiales bacterium]|nr:hypothetical protein [Hyphomicrobiales bacterium]